MQYGESLPLNDHEVVLTFDDGPLPPYTNRVLDTLASECVKATFFMVGRMVRGYPAVVRRVYNEGHTVANHSQSHPFTFHRMTVDQAAREIEDGFASLQAALGDRKAVARFFRIPVLLARLQFAFTVTFHIIFPSCTIGLSAFIATLLVRWIATGREHLHRLARFWTKIFAVSFGMGVVSGIVLSYEFGTNWSRFSVVVGNVEGPLLGYEVLSAFFLEATFLGILLFGWDRAPPWLSAL